MNAAAERSAILADVDIAEAVTAEESLTPSRGG
jgi:hypothetical protein